MLEDMRTLEGIDTLIIFTYTKLSNLLEDMRTLEGIDTGDGVGRYTNGVQQVRRYENP